MRSRHGFTLIELITVIVLLAFLSAVALPRLFDHGARARESADGAAIAGMKTALQQAYLKHRVDEAPSADWVSDVDDLRAVMETGGLPTGIVEIDADTIEDQRGNRYDLQAETASGTAVLELQTGGGGGGGGGGS